MIGYLSVQVTVAAASPNSASALAGLQITFYKSKADIWLRDRQFQTHANQGYLERERTRRLDRRTDQQGATMNKPIDPTQLIEFDAAPYLDNEASVAAYLTDILEANDSALLAAALGEIARARGMTEIARTAGITREALYKALRPDSAPRFDTIAASAPHSVSA